MTDQSTKHIALLNEAEQLVSFAWAVLGAYKTLSEAYDTLRVNPITKWGGAAARLSDLLQEDEQLTDLETILNRAGKLLMLAKDAAEEEGATEDWKTAFGETSSRFCEMALVDSLDEWEDEGGEYEGVDEEEDQDE